MKRSIFALMGVMLALVMSAAETDIKLAWPFTDHAVFQQGIYLPVWGTSVPHAKIKAEFNGGTFITHAAESGDFMLRLAPQTAGGPYTLSVSANDGTPLVIRDVMVGEVWIAGGQSNMEYLLSDDWSKHRSEPEAMRKNNLNFRQLYEYLDSITPGNTIRALRVPRKTADSPERRIHAVWEVMDRMKAGSLTAIGAWFGRDIQQATGVTVGIISCNWGGTRAEAWISRGGILSNHEIAGLVEERDQYELTEAGNTFSAEQFRLDFLKKYNPVDPGNKGEVQGWAKSDFDDSNWKFMTVPGSWIKQKMMGSGALWVRREVLIPETWVGKNLKLELGPVDKHDITYVNGVEVGRTGKDFEDQYWNVHRSYAIPAKLVSSTKLVIAIRAFSHYRDGALGGTKREYYLSDDSGVSVPLAGKWRAMPEVDLGYHAYRIPSMTRKYNRTSILFESMLGAIIPYGIRGVIWYQGESNADSINDSIKYRKTMASLIRDWRYHWQQGDFPFIQMQLANYYQQSPYSNTDAWCYLRESQLLVCNDLPNVYLASAIDIGEADDIHPQDKKEAGRRMALVARKEVYGEKELVSFGPVFRKAVREENALRISFANADGLAFKGGTAKGFYIAGKDRNFVPADSVVIEGDSILVSAKAVPEPAAVRYSWSNNPDGNLYNGAGLPAGSFRSDNW